MNDNNAPESQLDGVERAKAVVRTMLSAEGCAWHQVQTHESLTKYLVEEAYETVDAIEQGSAQHVAEELGDVLYQVLFHASLAERDGEGYSFDAIAGALADKLIARHPHVFGDAGYMTEAELNAEWEHLKEAAEGAERGSRHPLEGVPAGMASLARAAKVVERLRRAELLEAVAEPVRDEREIGDAMMRLVHEANEQGIDVDRAMRAATKRFADERLPDAAS